jgi:hypothetical protein
MPDKSGLQDSAVMLLCPVIRVKPAVCTAPFDVAVTVAVWLLETVPAVAVKTPLLAPEAIVTEAGTVRMPELLESETTVFALTALDIVTVQVDEPPLPRVLGWQVTDVNVNVETNETDAVAVVAA